MSEAVAIGATEIRLTSELIRELRDGRMYDMVQAEKAQRLAAKAGGERITMEHGEMKFQIMPEFYHYWGQRLGYECWDDPEFVREFLRDNPECRVKSRSRNIQVGYSPSAASAKFHKSYG